MGPFGPGAATKPANSATDDHRQLCGGLSDVIAVAGGYVHGLALKSNGTVWAWGDNFYGQLGNGNVREQRASLMSGLSFPARAQYKGSGMVNGSGMYTFLLTAVDGGVPGGANSDRFRIKIWNSGGTIFDNQLGSDDDADPTTELRGGSIVIHKR